jgi:hypothetical protein
MPSKGGKAKASKLTPKRRKEIARNATKSRWKRRKKEIEIPAQPGMPDAKICSGCDQPLTKVEFPKHYAFICLNWSCLKYRQPQIREEKNIESGKAATTAELLQRLQYTHLAP